MVSYTKLHFSTVCYQLYAKASGSSILLAKELPVYSNNVVK